ncbi:MAG TPA: V4R domain-containing protein [Gemmatimonadales bacterium]|jgi:predicted hydrocarbon binding protein|nr:V4R domain-containing protein [Gemmatimonadales bacterium]
MTDTFQPGRFGLTLSPRVLRQLRASLERDTGLQAASYLQEAGFAGGEDLYAAFTAWLAGAYGVDRAADLDARYLGDALSRFLAELGWGSVSVTPLGGSALAIDSADWAEAGGDAKEEYPSCHLTCGLLADFLGRISEGLVAVMEVECRSRGDARCRFLAGSPETLGTLYDRMAQGMSYDAALGAAGAGIPA